MDNLASRFFVKNDTRLDKVVFPLHPAWWSRPFEYAWAAEFAESGNVVLDAACGICHPFKFYLADKCKKVHAVDIDPRISEPDLIAAHIQEIFGEEAKNEFLEKGMYVDIEAKNASISELPYKNNMFDKVFCISVLEHIPDEKKLVVLKEFRRVLKNAGSIILTMDYSNKPEYSMVTMDVIEAMANEAGLKLVGERISAVPTDAINWNGVLYCFRMVLMKG
jgi:ubiquinone/menaquinone biosynthesis C-methylase UbiE